METDVRKRRLEMQKVFSERKQEGLYPTDVKLRNLSREEKKKINEIAERRLLIARLA